MIGLEAAFHVERGSFTLDVALSVAEGRPLAIVGPNGAGKSTALAALAGLVPATGRIRLGSRSIESLPPEERGIGVVFQDYVLFPHLSVLENVAFGPRSSGASRRESRAIALGMLDRFGIADLAARDPAALSGGQAQRVALARALATEPELLVLDEPLAALDVEVRDEVRDDLAAHVREWGGLTILVTHSLDDVTAIASDVVVIERGAVTQATTVRDLVQSPATPWISRLVETWSDD